MIPARLINPTASLLASYIPAPNQPGFVNNYVTNVPFRNDSNRFHGVVREVRLEGLLAQVEIDVVAPARVVALITSEAARSLGLRPGDAATAVVKSTLVMIEH